MAATIGIDIGGTKVLGLLVDEHGTLAARGYALLGLTPLALEVGDTRFSLVATDGTIAVHDGVHDDATVVELTPDAFSELVQETSTTLGLGMRGRVEMQRGTMDEFVAWEPNSVEVGIGG